jgi:hypothetical protein
MNGVFSPIAVGAAVAFCTLAATGQMIANDSPPYGSVQTAHFQNIEGSAEVDFQSRSERRESSDGASCNVFPYLNYVTLTHEEAFRADDGVAALLFPATEAPATGAISKLEDANGRSQVVGPVTAKEIGVPLESVATRIALLDEKPAKEPVKDSESESPKRFVAKPMSSIQLAGIDQPVSRTGEPLQTPTTSSGDSGETPIAEEHFSPEPWRRRYPSRNTFAFRHQPLYFEDPNLERCGQSAGCLTEAVNVVHFAGRIPLMGYLAGSNPPSSCVRALPDCPTCQSFGPEAYVPPPTVRAIATQAVHTVGMVFLIP